jgi:hypothetical protein
MGLAWSLQNQMLCELYLQLCVFYFSVSDTTERMECYEREAETLIDRGYRMRDEQ